MIIKRTNNPIKTWGTDLNTELSTDKSQMAERHLRECSTSLVIRQMQIKTTLRFHLTPVRMAKIKNTVDNLFWLERMWGKGNTSALLVGMQAGTTPLDVSVVISQKIRKQPSSKPSNTTLGIHPKDVQSYHKMFIAELFDIART